MNSFFAPISKTETFTVNSLREFLEICIDDNASYSSITDYKNRGLDHRVKISSNKPFKIEIDKNKSVSLKSYFGECGGIYKSDINIHRDPNDPHYRAKVLIRDDFEFRRFIISSNNRYLLYPRVIEMAYIEDLSRYFRVESKVDLEESCLDNGYFLIIRRLYRTNKIPSTQLSSLDLSTKNPDLVSSIFEKIIENHRKD